MEEINGKVTVTESLSNFIESFKSEMEAEGFIRKTEPKTDTDKMITLMVDGESKEFTFKELIENRIQHSIDWNKHLTSLEDLSSCESIEAAKVLNANNNFILDALFFLKNL